MKKVPTADVEMLKLQMMETMWPQINQPTVRRGRPDQVEMVVGSDVSILGQLTQ